MTIHPPRRRLHLAVATSCLLWAAPAFADNPGVSKSVPDPAQAGGSAAGSTAVVELDPADKEFVHKATDANVAEHLRGEAAAQHAESAAVKKLAGTLASDHAMLNRKLSQSISTADVQPGHDPSEKDATDIDHLKGLDKASFDAAYLDDELKAHQESIALYKKEIAAGKSSQLVAFARQSLPMLKKHEREIHKLKTEVASK